MATNPELLRALVDVKENEERALRYIDAIAQRFDADPRWTAIAITHLQQGVLALSKALVKPARIKLPEDQSVDPETGLVGERVQ